MKASVIDLFCGIGGLSHGFYLEGFDVVAGIDIDESCRYAFERNNEAKFIAKGVEDLIPGELKKLYPKDGIKILVGCAPCQPFSNYTQQYDKKRKKGKTNVRQDNKWKLLYAFADMIEEVQPDIVSMENVPQLTGRRGSKVYEAFLETLKNNGYEIDSQIVFCPDYGIPQTRKRLVLLASRKGKIRFIAPTHKPENYVTVRDTISKLLKIPDGGISPKDRFHRASKLTKRNRDRIINSKQGGTWRDWNKKLQLECHQKESGKTYPGVYGRMSWDVPSPTITTQFYGFGNGRFGHPNQNRAISIREAALLQTFPKNYEFLKPSDRVTFKKLGQFIGNAVPVSLGRAIAKSIKAHIENL